MKLASGAEPTLKHRYPFRLGTTSYIYPADILANVKTLQHRVDDIEIVLYESDEISNYPSEREIRQLAKIGLDSGLTYTVHLPLDTQLGDSDNDHRQRSVDKCIRAIMATSPLEPHGYIVHFQYLPSASLDRWIANLELSVCQMLERLVSPELLCVETLDHSFHLVEGLLDSYGLSICLDVGHIIFHDLPLVRYVRRYLPRARVIHLHGVRNGRDHRDLGEMPVEHLSLLFSRLVTVKDAGERVVTLEVFSERDLEISQAIVEKCCP